MTEEEIIQIWNLIPPQGDPTGKKFAVKFAEAVIQEERLRAIVEASEGLEEF